VFLNKRGLNFKSPQTKLKNNAQKMKESNKNIPLKVGRVVTLFIICFVACATATKLIMTVKGGPFNSLAPAVEENHVLYGDSYNRAYLYNALSDKDINKYEDGHKSKVVVGVVQNPVTKMVITAGKLGTVGYWNPKLNTTQLKLNSVLGKDAILSAMILTENNLLIVAGSRKEAIPPPPSSSSSSSSGSRGSSSSSSSSSSSK
jgi:hypothetical protein